jgi:HEAT repeat protein
MEDVLLKDPNADLRKEVAKAFGKVRNEKAVPALEAVRVGDSDIAVRQEADLAIREIKRSGS